MRNASQDESGLLVCRDTPRARPLQRLIAVPHAGAGPNSVARWSQIADAQTEMLFVRLPGRETRFAERPYEDARKAGKLLAQKLRNLPNLPTTLLGHSMGALIAYIAAAELSACGWSFLRGLVISGLNPPHADHLCPEVGGLSDEDFLRVLKKLGGLPPNLFGGPMVSREMMALFLPILRADFRLVETYENDVCPPLTCPIVAVSGALDSLALPDTMQQWERYTDNCFEAITHPGAHFAITEEDSAWHGAVQRALEVVNACAGATPRISKMKLLTENNGGHQNGQRT